MTGKEVALERLVSDLYRQRTLQRLIKYLLPLQGQLGLQAVEKGPIPMQYGQLESNLISSSESSRDCKLCIKSEWIEGEEAKRSNTYVANKGECNDHRGFPFRSNQH